MKYFKYVLISLSLINQASVILGMESNDKEALADYITIELANNKQAQILPEEFARLCEQSVTVQNDIAYLVGEDSILDTDGKLTVDYSQFPEHYSLSMIDEDTFAELLSYIVYGKISETIQDDCLCKLINIANYLDMSQLLNNCIDLFLERTLNANVILLLDKNGFKKYYEECNLSDDIGKLIIKKIKEEKLLMQFLPEKKAELSKTQDFLPTAAISIDSKFIVTNSAENNLKLWDIGGHLVKTINTQNSMARASLLFNKNNEIIAYDDDFNVKIYNISGKLQREFTIQKGNAEPYLIHVTEDIIYNFPIIAKHITLWNSHDGTRINQFHLPYQVTAIAISSDSKLLAVCCCDAKIYLFETASGKQIQIFDQFKHFKNSWPGTSVNFNADNNCIITTDATGLLYTWDLKLDNHSKMQVYANLNKNSSRAHNTKLAVSKNILVVYNSEKKEIKIISQFGQNILHSILVDNVVYILKISADEKFLFIGLNNGTMQIWDVMHTDLLNNAYSLKQAQLLWLLLHKKISLNKLPEHFFEIYETLPRELKIALANANLSYKLVNF